MPAIQHVRLKVKSLKIRPLRRVKIQMTQCPLWQNKYAYNELQAHIQTLQRKKTGETSKVPTGKTAVVLIEGG